MCPCSSQWHAIKLVTETVHIRTTAKGWVERVTGFNFEVKTIVFNHIILSHLCQTSVYPSSVQYKLLTSFILKLEGNCKNGFTVNYRTRAQHQTAASYSSVSRIDKVLAYLQTSCRDFSGLPPVNQFHYEKRLIVRRRHHSHKQNS